MGTRGVTFISALFLTAATASLAGCDREVMGPRSMTPSGSRAQLGIAAAPANDDFGSAIGVTALPFESFLDTREATTAPDDPFCAGQGPTVWYAFTPLETGFYEANTIGSDYDTTLGAYVGTRGDLTEIACNDDLGTLESRVVVELQAGETAYFMVGAFDSGPGGALVFNLLPAAPPPPPLEVGLTLDRVGSVDPRTGIATLRGTVTCSQPTVVDLLGFLDDRIGRIRVEAVFESFLECDGSTAWEAQVFAENALLVGGPAQVFVVAFFFDPITGQFAVAEQEATVRLRGGHGGRGARPTAAARGLDALSRVQQAIGKMRAAR